MQAMFFHVLVLLGLIFIQGFIALSGVALAAARKSQLREWASQGKRGAALAYRLCDDPRGLRWTIQSWTILLWVTAALYSGEMLLPSVRSGLKRVVASGDGGTLSFVLLSIALTLAGLIFGELIPRLLALGSPERIASIVSRPIHVLACASIPIVGLSNQIAERTLRAFGVRPRSKVPITPEEIEDLIQEGAKAGVFEDGEHEIFKRVFRFCDRRARALMTPRNQVTWIDVSDPPEEIRRKIISRPHSRFPVCDQSLDNLVGIVDVKNLLGHDPSAEIFRINGGLTIPLFLYEGTRGLKILEMFRKSPSRVAVVLDEYGTVEGLLTLTDILEAVVGDIPVTPDDNEPPAVERSDGSWLIDGRLPLDEFRDLFDKPGLPEGDFHTLAGLVVTHLGHIPRIAETFDCCGLSFEIVDMDGNRVDRVLVRPKHLPTS